MRHSTDELRGWLEAALAEEAGVRRPIAAMERRAGAYGSTWQTEDLDVTFDDGGRLALVMKDLSPAGALEAARGVRPQFLIDPAREIEVYRRILRPAAQGTPRFYGGLADAASGRYLLALERIAGTPIWQIGDFDTWCAAAAWLARLHRGCTGRAWAQSGASRLLRYNAEYYGRWAEPAIRNVRVRQPRRTAEPVAAFERLAAEYATVVGELVALPHAFIHGEFQASNVLVEDRGGTPAIRPLDWEMAALGPAMMDLADLSAGWPEPQRAALAATYARGAGVSDFRAMARALNLCRLHRAVQWLGWAPPEWRPPAEHAHDWLAEAFDVAREVGL